MWSTWDVGVAGAFLAAALLVLPLAALLAKAAYRLPRVLDSTLPNQPTVLHRRYRAGFWCLSVALAMVCAWRFGATPATAAAIAYMLTLLALAWIDAETGLLPDMLSLPLLWLGLLVNLNGAFTPLAHAVLGAAIGYLVLWITSHAFFLFTGRVGMGHGDFKLLAALGAWLGWMALPWVVLVSSSMALVVAVGLRVAGRLQAGEPLRFGPYLAAAGVLALLRL